LAEEEEEEERKKGRMNRSGRYLAAATTRRRLETPGRRPPDARDAPSHRNAAHLISGSAPRLLAALRCAPVMLEQTAQHTPTQPRGGGGERGGEGRLGSRMDGTARHGKGKKEAPLY